MVAPRTPHVEGRPVSATTYQRYRCRCRGCTDAQNAKMAEARRSNPRQKMHDRAQSKANYRALSWVKEFHPDFWRHLLEEAKREEGL